MKKNIKGLKPYLIIALAVLSLYIYFEKSTINEASKQENIVSVLTSGNTVLELRKGDEVLQNFGRMPDVEKIEGIAIKFGTYDSVLEGKLEVTLEEGKNQIFKQEIPLSEIQDNADYIIRQDINVAETSKTWSLKIEVLEIEPERKIGVYVGENIQDEKMRLLFNGNEKKECIGIKVIDGTSDYMVYVSEIFFVVCGIFLCVLYYLLFQKKTNILSVAIPMILFWGIIYMLLFTPNSVPDEEIHFVTAYERSNAFLQVKEKNVVMMRAEDTKLPMQMSVRKSAYDDILKKLGRRGTETELIRSTDRAGMKVPWFLHFPAACGITLARLIGANAVTLFYMGRFFNLVFFAITIWIAMRKIPVGKILVLLIALFPMTLQLIMSYSYDAVIIPVAIMFVSYCMHLITTPGKDVNLREFIIIAILGVFLAGSKSGAYMPLCFMIFLIPVNTDTECIKKSKISKYCAFTAAMTGYLLFSLSGALSNVSTTGGAVAGTGIGGYTVSGLLKDPLYLIKMIVNTIFEKIDFYYESLIGYSLGNFNVKTYEVFVFLFAVLFLIAIVDTEEMQLQFQLKARQKRIICVLLLLSVGLIEASMLLAWTPVTLDFIEGVQGRYFLPLLLPLAFVLRGKNFSIKRRLDKHILLVFSGLHVIIGMKIIETACR